jgi:hypothetical protein
METLVFAQKMSTLSRYDLPDSRLGSAGKREFSVNQRDLAATPSSI